MNSIIIWEHILNEGVALEDIQNTFLITQKAPNCVYDRYVQFKILHNRLDTRKMNILCTNERLYCKNQIDSTIHTFMGMPGDSSALEKNRTMAEGTYRTKYQTFWQRKGFWWGRLDSLEISIYDILRSIQNEMTSDEYNCEMNQKEDIFDKRWGICVDILRTRNNDNHSQRCVILKLFYIKLFNQMTEHIIVNK